MTDGLISQVRPLCVYGVGGRGGWLAGWLTDWLVRWFRDCGSVDRFNAGINKVRNERMNEQIKENQLIHWTASKC